MEQYDPAWCPNESDSGLRYTFQKQPDVSAWNCDRLADSFSSLIGGCRTISLFDGMLIGHHDFKIGQQSLSINSC